MSGTALIRLAVDRMAVLLGAEPELAKAFGRLERATTERKLKTFCKEGVTYTNRRVRRLKAAFRALGLKAEPAKSEALPGLIADALAAARGTPKERRDAAILAAIEPISHYGLALYTAIDRDLDGAAAKKARKLLAPSAKEKREAIAEMDGMAKKQVKALLQDPVAEKKGRKRQRKKR